MSDTKTLYTLQRVESKKDGISARLAKIDRLIAADRTLQAAIGEHEKANDELTRWQKRLADLEHERHDLKEDADNTETRLYSGKVTNPRELNDLQDKLAELKKRHASLENPLLEAMEQAEVKAKALTEAEKTLKQVKSERADTIARLSDERDALKDDLNKYNTRALQVRKKIAATVLSTFDGLRTSHQGIAVVVMTNGICGGCGVEIEQKMAQKVRHGEIIQCTTCDRFLYDEGQGDAPARDEHA